MFIKITDEMKKCAEQEAKKRKPYIKHHFRPPHLTDEQIDIIGFLGEFAACEYLNIDWKANIRENYETSDSGDGYINNKIFDVKTETIPLSYLNKLLSNNLKDNERYGERWINYKQVPFLKNYNIIIFGAFYREDTSLSQWYPLGWINTNQLQSFNITKNHTKTPTTDVLKIPSSKLMPMKSLKRNK